MTLAMTPEELSTIRRDTEANLAEASRFADAETARITLRLLDEIDRLRTLRTLNLGRTVRAPRVRLDRRGHTYDYDLAAWEAGGKVGPKPVKGDYR